MIVDVLQIIYSDELLSSVDPLGLLPMHNLWVAEQCKSLNVVLQEFACHYAAGYQTLLNYLALRPKRNAKFRYGERV